MKKRILVILICVTSFFQGTGLGPPFLLPSPTGPYGVGTQAIELADPSRSMLRGGAASRWRVQAFYPTDASEKQIYPYMPETLKEGLLEGVKVFSYASPKGGILKKHSWPLIIFKPGLGGCGQEYTILCEELASHGYVVLTVDQPYVSNFVRFLDGSAIVLTLRDAWYISRDRDYRYKYYDEAMAAAMAEIKFMLTHFQDINSTYFSGQLDPLSIVLMGHSFGGNIAHTLGFEDPRIKAVIDIDSKITERKIYGRVGVPPNPHQKPVLFIRGKMQYQEDVGSQLTKIHNAYIWEPAVEHSAFRDMAYLVRYHPHLRDKGIFSKFWNWFWKLGPLFDDVDTDVGDQEVNEWFGEYRTKIVQWLDKVAPSPVETEKLHMDFREKAL